MAYFYLHLAVIATIGTLSVRLLLDSHQGRHLFTLSLGWGLGAGISSILGLLSLLLAHDWSRWLLLVEALILVILTLFWLQATKGDGTSPTDHRIHGRPKWYHLLVGITGLLLILTVLLFVLITMAKPHGRWDSWMIWNLRARFLFRSTDQWSTILNPLIIHADYPLLIPLNVAMAWVMASRETVLAPAAIALLFTFAPAGLLAGYFQNRNMPARGLVAAICLMGTPFFLYIGVDQVADTPLSLYFLSTIVLLLLSDQIAGQNRCYLLLAGLMAALAGWTKNEGLLFIPVVLFCRLLVPGQDLRNYFRTMKWFVVGLLPVMAVILYFKLGLAPANDLWASRSPSEIIAKLTDPHRYLQVARAYATVLYGFSYWPTVSLNVLLLAYALVCGFHWNRLTGELRWLFLLLLLMLAGYFGVFILTPHDLAWHLHTAQERLFVQLYPAGLLLYFLLLPAPRQGSPQPASGPGSRNSGTAERSALTTLPGKAATHEPD